MVRDDNSETSPNFSLWLWIPALAGMTGEVAEMVE